MSAGMTGVHPNNAEFGTFENNTAHNNNKFGVWGISFNAKGTGVFLRTKTWGNTEGIDMGKHWLQPVHQVTISEHMWISDRAGAKEKCIIGVLKYL